MGCWNKTCFVSNIAIRWGEPVAVFFMARSTDNSNTSFCYADYYFEPCYMPVFGNYNDYGAAEDFTGPGEAVVVEKMKNILCEQSASEYRKAVTSEDLDMEKMFRAEHEGRLKVRREQPVLATMIHREVFDYILDNWTIDFWRDKEADESLMRGEVLDQYHMRYRFTNLVQELEDNMEKLWEARNKFVDTEGVPYFPDLRSMFRRTSYIGSILAPQGMGARDFLIVDAFLDLLLPSSSQEDALAKLTDYMKGQCLGYFLDRARKSWYKPTGEGSQDDSYTEIRLLNSVTESIFKARENETY
jgi:hypothetical protein